VKGKNNHEKAAEVISISSILTASGYALDIFTNEEIATLEIIIKRGKPFVKCFATGKERSAKPEEIVRQLYLRKLIYEYGYPASRIALERGVYFGSSMHEKRADIVVFEKDAPETPYIIVECKKPKRKDGWSCPYKTGHPPNLTLAL
jgi:type I restriction enzyme M protein